MFLSLYTPRVVLPKSHVIMAVRRSAQTFMQRIKPTKSIKAQHSGNRFTNKPPLNVYRGIRFRLTVFVLLLIAVTTFSIAIMVMQVMDRTLLNSMIQRGSAITLAAATPAGYSLLMNDRLALDNLAAQIQSAQAELVYVAILDLEQNIMAHNRLDQVGGSFSL